jgi:succinoglycan biosynthesis transport protein ExoP
MELWQYYRILRRRRWLIIIGTVICVSIVIASDYLGVQKYEAYTTVMEKSPGDDKINIFAPAYVAIDPKTRLANLVQLVKSQTVMQRSADTLMRLQITAAPNDVLSTLNASPVLDTMILEIKVQSPSEDVAKAAADIVAREFQNYYRELNYSGVERSKRFIEQQLPKAEVSLGIIREKLRQFKVESGAVMLRDQTSALISESAQMQTALAQHDMQAQQANAKLANLEIQMKAYPKSLRVTSQTMAKNPVWQGLQSRLAQEEGELQKMLQTRTPEHPEVLAINKQLAAIQSKMREVGADITASITESIDPRYDLVGQSYVQALVEYSAETAATSAARGIVSEIDKKLEALPDKEMQLAKLELDEKSATNTYALLRQKLDEASIRGQEAENVSTIQVVDTAKTRPADARKQMKLILALILSPIFCAGMAFLLNYLDNSVKTPEEVEQLLKLPVFAAVPMARHHSLVEERRFPAVDMSYQMLSTNLSIDQTPLESRSILIASAEPDVGRSITAANLATTLARDGARVILVDTDLRQPSQHVIFHVDNEKGLSNVLAGQLALTDALQPTKITDLLLLPSGPLPANPMRLFHSPEMGKFVTAINDLADFVVFDSPAGVAFADSVQLASFIKNVLIVYAAGTVPRGAEVEFCKRLDQVSANVLGVVLNMVNPEDSHGFYYFRSGYEELLRYGKNQPVLAGRAKSAIPEEKDSNKVEGAE